MTSVESLLSHLNATLPHFSWEREGQDGLRAATPPWVDATPVARMMGGMSISLRKVCIVVCTRDGMCDIVEHGSDARVCVDRALARAAQWIVWEEGR